ncbi:lycopene cyclase family protein [Demequina sp. SYSU T00192]|uniref:Lycopene cyclase family protein n=1 Tax=Demequina litoralis TaxID=3051660 RepID=A0ABT8G8P9_9MICO|nr:lycopene cyclase family protein [Demequina sp. SYSU T00192]MDN4475517.1 lycopene cyclase family protein [Demequina sp. SYSU T00192]
MPGTATVDAVIVGGGAAGLLLAAHLAAIGWGDDVLVLDDGAQPLEDRAWAWWSTGGALLDRASSRAFEVADVAGEGWARRLGLGPYAYRVVTGPELGEAVARIVRTRRGYRRLSGTARGLAVDDAGVQVAYEDPDGRARAVRARWVFDSVGPGAAAPVPDPDAVLDVAGIRIETARDAFDPAAVTLMDFRTGQEDGVAFAYVLPTSARTALVERTVYAGPEGLGGAADAHEARLAAYVRDVLGLGEHRIVAHESGTIPLVLRPPARPDGPVVPIGARAGMVKPSTGYAFGRIQRHSAAIAAALAAGRYPGRAVPHRRWARTQDAALLRAMRTDPAAARGFLEALLTRNPGPRILAFLDEDLPAAEHLRLYATLPLPRLGLVVAAGSSRRSR